jgi:hypothetical protein
MSDNAEKQTTEIPIGADHAGILKRHIQERDQAAQVIGVAWIEFEQLRVKMMRKVDQSIREEKMIVAQLAAAYGIDPDKNKFRLDYDRAVFIKEG